MADPNDNQQIHRAGDDRLAKRRVNEIIDNFVSTSEWGETWASLVEQLIEPLGLEDVPGNLCEAAQANLRQEWPESWNNKALWLSRTGPWCRAAGRLKIIEIIRKTALRLQR